MIIEKIQKAISIIQKRSELFVSGTIVKRTEGYDVNSGTVTATTSNKTVQGVFEQFDVKEIDNVQVFQDDVKFIVFAEAQLSIDSLNDKVIIENIEYDIVKYRNLSVGTTKILHILQLRR